MKVFISCPHCSQGIYLTEKQLQLMLIDIEKRKLQINTEEIEKSVALLDKIFGVFKGGQR